MNQPKFMPYNKWLDQHLVENDYEDEDEYYLCPNCENGWIDGCLICDNVGFIPKTRQLYNELRDEDENKWNEYFKLINGGKK